MRILVLAHIPGDGGVSSKTCELAHYLGCSGNIVKAVFFKQKPRHYLVGKIEHSVYKRMNPLTVPKEVRQFQPDVVVMAYSSYLGLSSKATGLGVPFVPIIHGQGVRFYNHSPARRKVLRRMAGGVLRSYPTVIVLNRDLEKTVIGLGVKKDRVKVLKNGVDLERFKLQKGKREFDLVFSGSLYKEKRLDILFDALRLIGEGKKGPSLLVMGEGPQLEQWKQQAKGLNVTFQGFKKDIWNHYPRARIFVLSSDSEEFPGAPLEAMACGLPVVATKVGSMPQVVKQARTSLLVPPGDPDSLAAAIEGLLKDRALCHDLGTQGQQDVKKYSWENVVVDYQRVFSSIVKNR